MTTSKALSWNDRIAIIERYKPTDTEIKQQMGVSQHELDTARELRNSGVVIPTKDIDFDAYSSMFSIPSASKPAKKVTIPVTKNKTAQTASKSVSVPKKRGRKGNKISVAFSAIPTTATSAEQFALDHNISVPVLRQSKRFDVTPEMGAVRVKINKTTKTLEVWRDAPEV